MRLALVQGRGPAILLFVAALAALLGLPGRAAHAAGLVIHEVLVEAPAGFPEFVEIYNASPPRRELGGFRLSGTASFVFAEGTAIEGLSYLVLASDPGLFRSCHGFEAHGAYTGSLLDESGRLLLNFTTREGAFVCRAEIETLEALQAPRARGGGSSLELRSPAMDGTDPASWALSLALGGTPGRANSAALSITAEPVVPPRGLWRYWKGTSPPSAAPLAWTELGFDDGAWSQGAAPFGYGNADDATLLDDMRGGYTSLYLRRELTYRAGEEVIDVILSAVFDDGFVAYLNGRELLRRNLGEPGTLVPHDAVAERQRFEGVRHEFRLPELAAELREGRNVLAVHAANDHLRSSDFQIDPALVLLRGTMPAARFLLNEAWRGDGRVFLELFHDGDERLDLEGSFLLSSRGEDPFALPRGLRLEPGSFAVVEAPGWIFTGTLILAGAGSTVLDAASFPEPLPGGASGRFPDGAGRVRLLGRPTAGGPNAAPRPGAVAIHEIHYHPLRGREEFVELLAREAVDLGGWRLGGAIEHTFAPGTILEAGDLIAVARDPPFLRGRHGGILVAGPFRGRLPNDTGTLIVLDPLGREVERVRYADDGSWPREPDGEGPSLELLDPSRGNESGLAWRASLIAGGTPGRPNSVSLSGAAPPLIQSLEHHPLLPLPGEAIEVSARIEGGEGVIIELHHREDGAEEWKVEPMRFDGRFFRAPLAPRSEGTVVEYAIRAREPGKSAEEAWFPAGDPGSALIEIRERRDSPVETTYRLILRARDLEALRGDPLADVLRPATLVAGGRAYHDVRVRYRGHGSRLLEPKSYRLVFTDENRFEEMKVIFLNAFRPERQVMGMDLWRRAGLPYSRARLVRLTVNGEYFPAYAKLEPINERYLERHFGESDGNLYRGQRQADFSYLGADPAAYEPLYEKHSNEEERDWSDVILLSRVFAEASDEEFPAAIAGLIDVEEWIDWIALNTVLSNLEGGLHRDTGDDYFLYRSPHRGFVLLPWDMDSTYLEPAEPLHRPSLPAIRRLITHPSFAPLYLRSVARLLDLHFAPADVERQAAFLLDFLGPEVQDEVVAFAKERRAFLERSIPSRLSATAVAVPPELGFGIGQRLYSTALEVTLSGTAPALQTARVLVSGREAAYTPWSGTWSFALRLPARERRLAIEALDERGAHVESLEVVVERLAAVRTPQSLPAGESEWTAAGSPYLLPEAFAVPVGSSLRIHAGARLLLAPGSVLSVGGALHLEGEPGTPVHVGVAATGQRWPEVRVLNGGVAELRHLELSAAPAVTGPQAPEKPLFRAEKGELRAFSSTFRDFPGRVLQAVDGVLEVADCSFYRTGEAVHGVRSRVVALRNLMHSLQGDSDAIDLDEEHGGLPCDCRIEENTIIGGDDDGIDLLNSSALVRGNLLVGVGDRALSIEGRGAPRIEGNTIIACGGGIVLKDGTAAWGGHNTVTRCLAGVELFVKNPSQPGAAAVFHSSIIWGNARDVFADSDSRLEVDHSCLGAEPERWGASNFSAAPLFAAADDLRLRPGSPCLTAGREGSPAGARGLFTPRPPRLERLEPGAAPVQGGITATLHGSDLEGFLDATVDGCPLEHAALLATGAVRGLLPAARRAGAAMVEVATRSGKTALPAGVRYTRQLIRGDANGDLRLDISDAVTVLWHLLGDQELAVCAEAADFDGDRRVTLTDAVALLAFLFEGGQEAPEARADCE
jgi:hypothetical protein